MRNRWKGFMAGLLSAVLCMGSFAQITGSAEESDTAMGRYVEEELTLPENFYVRDIVRTDEETLRIIGTTENMEGSMVLMESSDGGESWEETGKLSEESEELYFLSLKLAPDGGGAGTAMMFAEGADDYTYYYVSFDAQGNTQTTQVDDYPGSNLQFAADGTLLACQLGSQIVTLDRATGEVLTTVAEFQAEVIGTVGTQVLAVSGGQLAQYDYTTGEPAAIDTELENALFADGAGYVVTTTLGYPIVFAEDEESRLYYVTDQGIFAHVMDGGVVERAVDGSLTSLYDPSVEICSLAVLDNCFYVICNIDGHAKLLKYAYDESISSVPQNELTIYSLKENAAIRQAVVLFQKQYPDTYVKYAAGMSGEDGVTASDALRTLNTDILAGSGPDVLVLDGMSIDTYRRQGLLTDLSDVVKEVSETDGLFENVTEAYRTEDMLAAVPAGFSLQIAAGDPALIEGLDSMEALKELAAQTNGLDATDVISLTGLLYPSYAGSWKNEDGTIDQEKLAEFVNGIYEVTRLYRENAVLESQELQALFERYDSGEYTSYDAMDDLFSIMDDTMAMDVLDLLENPDQVALGTLGNVRSYMGLTSVNKQTGKCVESLLALGQQNVFVPGCVLGVVSTSKSQERALDFVRYVLSAEEQCQMDGFGFPVNRTAFEELLHPESEDAELVGFTASSRDGEDYVELTYEWPTDEELDVLRAMVEQVSVCAETERVPKEVISEEISRCLSGEISADEAVNSIMQKMNLYLAE